MADTPTYTLEAHPFLIPNNEELKSRLSGITFRIVADGQPPVVLSTSEPKLFLSRASNIVSSEEASSMLEALLRGRAVEFPGAYTLEALSKLGIPGLKK